MALRCDDCATYHLEQCVKKGIPDDEIWEAMAVALIVGGSIVIPHLRRAVETLKELRAE
jgi:alkylhydroperoxidase/carboxymuconolactone decarboxylase family protein YurZ